MRWICILTLILLISGCSQYKQVLIPVACEISQRERPKSSGDMIEDIKAILIYSEGIEQDLDFCTGKKPP